MNIEDYINVDSLRKLCDYEFDCEAGVLPPTGLVHLHLDSFHHYLHLCNPQSPKHVLVCTGSDFGIFYQDQNHSNEDLTKKIDFYDWGRHAKRRDKYVSVIVDACDAENSIPEDKYSVKTYAHTRSTFNELPANIIRMYACNLMVQHDRMKWIPFGMNGQAEAINGLNRKNLRKDGLMYVNFQNHTRQRISLKKYFKQFKDFTIVDNANVPVNEYLESIAKHKFTLCPYGNGLDCFRTYEAIYLGSIPILEKTIFTYWLEEAGLPVLIVDDFAQVTPEFLKNKYLEILASKLLEEFNLDKIVLSYWKKEFELAREYLLNL